MRPARLPLPGIGRALRALALITLLGLAVGLPAATAAPSVLVLDAHGHVRHRPDPWLGPATTSAGRPPAPAARAHAARSAGPSVLSVLAALERGGAITAAAQRSAQSDLAAAQRAIRATGGTRRAEISAVLANLTQIAASGQLSGDRVAPLFLTLERNVRWWTTGPLLSDGARVSFSGSRIVWQYYAGQGIEIQWLGTFGTANGLWSSGQLSALRSLMAEVVPLASARAGGIAWEYLFRFDGGTPPWTSGLSQGTAIQALARASVSLHDPSLMALAHRALGIFTVGPPAGVRVATPAGAHYLEYTYAPSDRILNGFVQSLVGLYDYATLSGDPQAVGLFEAGDAEARVEVPHYDTGAWSLYDQFGESDLSYHELLRDFLEHLCQRTTAPATAPPAPGGGTAPQPEAALVPDPAADAIYCTTATHFSDDLHRPPVLAPVTSSLVQARSGRIVLTLSKISQVTMSIRRGSTLVYRSQALLGHGRPALRWTPSKAGRYTVTVAATDLAGNTGQGSGPLTVTPAPRRR